VSNIGFEKEKFFGCTDFDIWDFNPSIRFESWVWNKHFKIETIDFAHLELCSGKSCAG